MPLLVFSTNDTCESNASKLKYIIIFLIKTLVINKLDKRFRTRRVTDASVVGRKNTNIGTKSMKSYFVDLPPVLHSFIPDFDYLLFSLSDMADDQLISIKNVILSMSAMLLKHSHDENDEFLKLTPFWLEKIKELDAQQQLDFIRSAFVYIQNAINLTNREIPPIFTKVSNNVNDIAMTIADHIREETSLNNIKNLIQKGASYDLISKSFGIPMKKIQEIVQKIKESNQ